MYALRVPGAVNTQDVVWEFVCAVYKNVILSLRRNVTLEPNCLKSYISHSTCEFCSRCKRAFHSPRKQINIQK